MRHKSYTTTQGYINLASQLEDAVANMPVPKILQKQDPKEDNPEKPST